jgi:hypothetical protein
MDQWSYDVDTEFLFFGVGGEFYISVSGEGCVGVGVVISRFKLVECAAVDEVDDIIGSGWSVWALSWGVGSELLY